MNRAFILAYILVFITGCRSINPDEARAKLAGMKIEVSERSFYNRLMDDDRETARLILLAKTDGDDFESSNLKLAAALGELDLVKKAVAAGDDVNDETVENGFTPLVYAMHYGAGYDVVKFLVDSGAKTEIDPRIGERERYLWHAALRGDDIRILKLVLQKGGNIEAYGSFGQTPLAAVAVTSYRNNEEIFDLLLRHGADINGRGWDGETPLFHALHDLESVKYIVAKGGDVNARNYWGRTPLMECSSLPVLKYLVEHGADVNAESLSGYTPLMNAAHAESLAMVKYLIGKGADVHAQNDDGDTAIDEAGLDSPVEKYLKGYRKDSHPNRRNYEEKKRKDRQAKRERLYGAAREKGRADAENDVKDENYIVWMGYIPGKSRVKMLIEVMGEHGLKPQTSARGGCVICPYRESYWEGYDQVMNKTVKEKLGDDIFERIGKESVRRWQAFLKSIEGKSK